MKERCYSLGIKLCLLALITLTGCADLTADADAIAEPSGMKRQLVSTDAFLLTAYGKITAPNKPVDVYIEGDGLAWLSTTEISPNPTPHKATTLSLAALDPAPNVIYIARPCQFTPLEADPHCDMVYWTDRRFSEEVIASVSQAIDKLIKARMENVPINLIGYSGGGAVAVLVAARRHDVATIRTVAGNLDHDEVNRTHEVSLMLGSLNPINEATKVAAIPQLHLSGDEDTVITPHISERFRDAAGSTSCIHLQTIPGASHESGWIEHWSDLLKEPVTCDQ